jgi:hypothetical protein
MRKELCAMYRVPEAETNEQAMRWALSASECLPLKNKVIKLEDGESYHDGSISTVLSDLFDIDEIVEKYLHSPIYNIFIHGHYNETFVVIQVLYRLKKVYISGRDIDEQTICELEQCMGLTDYKYFDIKCFCGHTFQYCEAGIPDNAIYEAICPSCGAFLKRKKIR